MQCTCVLHSLGTKYRYAKQWGIHCVSAQWFHDSVEAGYSMPEGDYDVDKEQGEAGEEGRENSRGTSRKRYMYIHVGVHYTCSTQLTRTCDASINPGDEAVNPCKVYTTILSTV